MRRRTSASSIGLAAWIVAVVAVLGALVGPVAAAEVPPDGPVILGPEDAAMPGTIVRADGPIPSVPGLAAARVAEAPVSSVAASTPTATFTVSWNPDSCTYATSDWPIEAMAAFEYAADLWAGLVESSVPIAVDACWSPLGANVLGSAGTTNIGQNFTGAPEPDVWYPISLVNALSGIDLNGSTAELVANFSSEYANWYFGTDAAPGVGQYDFVTVVAHELAHGLGLAGSMTVDASTNRGYFGYFGDPYAFDVFAVNGGGNVLVDTWPSGSTALASQLTGGNLFFDGPAVRSANGGLPAALYAPGTWAQGSSFSHLDTVFDGTAHALMTHSIGAGESVHHPGAVGLGILDDLGWTVAAVSEPDPEPDPEPEPDPDPEPVPTPTITRMSPGEIGVGAAATLTIDGTELDTTQSVTVGSASAAAIRILSSTRIEVDVPGLTEGEHEVRVTTESGSVVAGVLSVVNQRLLTGLYAASTGTEAAVARLYMAVFLRQPDAGGFDYWLDRARSGTSLRQMAAFFVVSPEFQARYGGLDDGAFVDLIYRNVMNREPDAAGRAYWIARLGNGTSRSEVTVLFSDSPEFRALTGTS